MAKIRREKEIDLSRFDSSWTGARLFVFTRSFREVQEFEKSTAKIDKEMFKAERALKKAERAVDKAEGEQIEVAEKALEEAKDNERAVSGKMVDAMIKIISDSFSRGQIYDHEQGKLVELTAADLDQFDTEVLKYIVENITGSYSKKD